MSGRPRALLLAAALWLPALPALPAVADGEAGRRYQGAALGQSLLAEAPQKGLLIQRRSFGVARQPELDAYLNVILQRLQASLPQAPAAARVYLTPDPSFAAHSTPDGAIFLALGTLRSLESEDELAAVIAHEYAHVQLGHGQRDTVNRVAGQLYGLGALALNYLGRSMGDTKQLRAGVAGQLGLDAVQGALVPLMSRDQEREADLAAADLLARSGYSLLGLRDFLRRLASWDQQRQRSAGDSLQQPRSQEMAKVDREMQRRKGRLERKHDIDLQPVVLGLDQLLAATGAALRREHDATDERSEALRAYLKAAWQDAPRPERTTLPWTAAGSGSPMGGFLDGLAQFHELLSAKERRDHARVRQLSERLPDDPVAGVPYVAMMRRELRLDRLRRDDEAALLSAAVDHPESLFPDHFEYIRRQARRSVAEGLEAAQSSNRALDDPPELLPELIRLNARAGNKNVAAILANKCLALGYRDLVDLCAKAQRGR